MPLTIASTKNPYDSANPLIDAFGVISGIALDTANPGGRVVLDVFTNAAAAATDRPIKQVPVQLGQIFATGDPTANPPVAPTSFITLAGLMRRPGVAAAYELFLSELEEAFLAHPDLVGATVIP